MLLLIMLKTILNNKNNKLFIKIHQRVLNIL